MSLSYFVHSTVNAGCCRWSNTPRGGGNELFLTFRFYSSSRVFIISLGRVVSQLWVMGLKVVTRYMLGRRAVKGQIQIMNNGTSSGPE